jgi:hypothetical protein
MRGIFSKIAGYKAPIYFMRGLNVEQDYTMMIEILHRKLGFTKIESEEATAHTLQIAPNKPLEDKMVVALKYLDKGKDGDD